MFKHPWEHAKVVSLETDFCIFRTSPLKQEDFTQSSPGLTEASTASRGFNSEN